MDKDKLRLLIYEKYSDGEISLDQREILLERVNDLVLSENMTDDDFYATEGIMHHMLKGLSSLGGAASTLTKAGAKTVTGSAASKAMNSGIDTWSKGMAQRKMDRMHYRRPDKDKDVKVSKQVIEKKGSDNSNHNGKTRNPLYNASNLKSKRYGTSERIRKNHAAERNKSGKDKSAAKYGDPNKVNRMEYKPGHTASAKEKTPNKMVIYRFKPSNYAVKYNAKIKKLENKYRKVMKGSISVGADVVKDGIGVVATIGLISLGIVPVVATTVGVAAIGTAALFGKSFKGMADEKAQKDLDKAEIRLKKQHDKLIKERAKIIEKGQKHLLSPDQLRKASRRWEKRSLAFVKDCDKVKDRYNRVRAQVSAKANGNTSFIKNECGFTVADNGDYVYEDGSVYNNKPATEYGLMSIVDSIKYESPNSDRVYEVVDFVIENANLDNAEDYEAYMKCVSIFENSSVFDD